MDWVTRLTKDDLYLLGEGTHAALYEKLGAHPMAVGEVEGTYFAVWAPEAQSVSVVGSFNSWNPRAHSLALRSGSGVWEGFVAGIGKGTLYKYHVVSRHQGYRVDKADPVGFLHETPPRTASIVWRHDYDWQDAAWMASRAARQSASSPVSIYEVHLGSWRRAAREGNRWLSYREIAPRLAEYVSEMGFTHVELMPVMEHPFFGSWGYQTTGYFAPSHRYGKPEDLMFLIDTLHHHGIGVILDWVPSHFPADEHGPGFFDGTHVYEHADPRQGFHPDWTTFIFNYGRSEVRSFLVSSALFWLDRFHADGLRVDGVASMLYLDYSRQPGEWVPNKYGGRENLEAIQFLRQLNDSVHARFPEALTFAEESTSWPMVSRPTHLGGLGFSAKWDMGWMHDTLDYMSIDPLYRKYHQARLTFRPLYAWSENFMLPLSHDEVVHGKRALLGKMAGPDSFRFANLRLLYAMMWAQPGKKLLFMGCEMAPWREWRHESQLDWIQGESAPHAGVRRLVADLNRLYSTEPALHELDWDPRGFKWMDCTDAEASVVSFIRRGRSRDDLILVAVNATPIARVHYRVGVPRGGYWREVMNSDAREYGGQGFGNLGGHQASTVEAHDQPFSLSLTLPPLGVIFMKSSGGRIL